MKPFSGGDTTDYCNLEGFLEEVETFRIGMSFEDIPV